MAEAEHMVSADSRGEVIRRWFSIAPLIALALAGCSGERAAMVYPIPWSESSVEQIAEGIRIAEREVVPSPDYPIRGLIVPHHLTASQTIAAGTRMLRGQNVRRIVLLSPDHFHACPALLCTTKGTFRMPVNVVKTDNSGVDELLTHADTALQPELFGQEHGIFAVLPFLEHDLPGVPVVPVTLNTDFKWKAKKELIWKAIAPLIDDGTVLVVSSDFSHYLPLKKSDQMDEATAQALFAKDIDGIMNLKNSDQSDCPGCLWVLARIADVFDFYNPSVIRHTNSARILKEPDVQSTTSHFAIAFYENALLNSGDTAFAGDLTITRLSKDAQPRLSPPVAAFWSGTGSRIVNLEGPLAPYCPPQTNPYTFCNLQRVWLRITALGTHWGIVNNHMLDRFEEGISETQKIIEAAHEIPVTADGYEDARMRIIPLTMLMNPVRDTPKMNLPQQYQRALELFSAKNDDRLTVAFIHGGNEYHALVSDSDRASFEKLIDAGADAVIVAHSHVVSDLQIYKGKPIFRGLGNFYFDQHDAVPTSTAKIVRLRKEGDHIAFQTFISK